LLNLAGVPDECIVVQEPGVIYAIDRVIVPSLRNPHGLLDAASLSFFATLRERFGQAGNRKIYVSRDGWNKRGLSGVAPRAMVNEAEVIRALEDIGFETVRPHELTMREHIERFSSASVVISAGGSMLFNTFFCNPGTKIIDIESEPHWIFMHMNLLGSAGHDFGVFEAQPADSDWARVHKPYSVNIPALMDRVRRFAASPVPSV
jgi:capsular polysaccharide biosynthesis protein